MAQYTAPIFVLLLAVASDAWDDSGFSKWFVDSLDEASNVPLVFEGKVPDYISGTFAQAGPGRFTMGDMHVGHAFDGFSKLNRITFSHGAANFTTYFPPTAFLNNSLKQGKIAPGITLGETSPPSREKSLVRNAFGANDNNYVKPVKFGENEWLLSDTVIASQMSGDFTHLDKSISPTMCSFAGTEHWTDHGVALPAHICLMGTMAHGHVDPDTQVFTGVMGCISPVGPVLEDHHIVFTIDPAKPRERRLLADIPLPRGRQASYMHSMATTKNYVILIAEPLHLDVEKLLLGHPLGEGGLALGNETLFQVVDRRNGAVRSFSAPGFLHGHVVNAWEDGDDILFDLTWYSKESFSFFHVFLMKNLMNKTARDQWELNKLMRYRLHASGAVTSNPTLPEELSTSFELPKMNPNFHGSEYCTFYGWQVHAYRYDLNQSAAEAGPFAAVAIAKRNVCTGEQSGFYRPNQYPSEHEFIADPKGQAEDDGALLGFVFDANTDTTYFHVLDAKTMTELARAPVPVRIPFAVHVSFFPEAEESSGSKLTTIV